MPALHTRLSPPALIAALVLHGLAFVAWQSGLRVRDATSPHAALLPRIELRIVPVEPAAEATQSAPTANVARSEAHRSRRLRGAITPSAVSPSMPVAATAGTGTEAATSPPSSPGLEAIDTRRAVRDSAVDRSAPARMAVEAGEALRGPGVADSFAASLHRSARGDCAKGDYAGGGMGLLSLPFLAAAAARGDCAR